MFHTTLTAEQRIERAHVALMNHPSTLAFSGVIMVGKTSISEEGMTAATNGVDVVYGRAFVSSLSEPALTGLVLHENLHKCYQHIWLWQDLYKDNAEYANMACDYVINAEIKALEAQYPDFIQLPACGLYSPKYAGMDSKQVFDLLKQDNVQPQSGIDSHDWEDAEQLDEAEKEQIKAELDNAIRQGAMLAGKLGGDVPQAFDALMEAKVNWKEQLAQYVTEVCTGKDDSTWRRPNRRWLAQDVYMPSQVTESLGRVVIGIDTSGSVDQTVITRFLSEVMGICEAVQPETIDLLYWDTAVAAHEFYEGNGYQRLAQSTKPKGGGGTDAACVPRYLKTNGLTPVVTIMLTDGYMDSWGKWDHPVVWCLVDNKRTVPPCGSVVRVG